MHYAWESHTVVLGRTPYVDMPDQQHKFRGRTSLDGTHENLLTGLAL